MRDMGKLIHGKHLLVPVEDEFDVARAEKVLIVLDDKVNTCSTSARRVANDGPADPDSRCREVAGGAEKPVGERDFYAEAVPFRKCGPL